MKQCRLDEKEAARSIYKKRCFQIQSGQTNLVISMKQQNILIVLLSAFLLTGCASNYNVVLTNGRVITASSKPKLDTTKNRYVFKDVSGQPMEVPPGLVREIEPTSMASEDSKFTSSSGR
jgi:hypothetical protein